MIETQIIIETMTSFYKKTIDSQKQLQNDKNNIIIETMTKLLKKNNIIIETMTK